MMDDLDLDVLLKMVDGVAVPRQQPRIIITDAATVADGFYFKNSKHRSRRQFKKLLKRFGSQERRKPACLKVYDDMWIHPSFEKELMTQTKQAPPTEGILGGLGGIPVYRGYAPMRLEMFKPTFDYST